MVVFVNLIFLDISEMLLSFGLLVEYFGISYLYFMSCFNV